MKIVRTGVDLVDIPRIAQALERYGNRFLARIYTDNEIAESHLKPDYLAARFASKEAVAKALGCGIGVVGWQEIEVLRGSSGEPILFLHGAGQKMADQLGLTHWSISISHTQQFAVALIFAVGE